MEGTKIFYRSLVVFIASILLASFLPKNFSAQSFLFFALFLLAIFSVFVSFGTKARIFGYFLVAASFGFWIYALHLPRDGPDKIWYYNDAEVLLQGRINAEPDARVDNQKLEISYLNLLNPSVGPVSGTVLLSVDLFPRYRYGEEIEFVCRPRTPEEFNGFRYDRFLARHGIYSLCHYPEILNRNSNPDLNLIEKSKSKIFLFKEKCRERLNYGLSGESTALARAVLLGDKRALDENARNNFSRSGLSHIAVISGLHISIIIATVMGVLLLVGINRRQAFYAVVFILAFYLILIGSPPSAMRAGLMGFLVLLAAHVGRLSKLKNSLLIAAAILLSVNPFLIRDDIGFQLSFLALIGIMQIYPFFKKVFEKLYFDKFKASRLVKEILAVTLAAQIATAPVLYYNFGSVSIIAPAANLLVLWLLPFLLMFLFFGLGSSFLLPELSGVFFLPASLILEYILFISRFFAQMPFAAFPF